MQIVNGNALPVGMALVLMALFLARSDRKTALKLAGGGAFLWALASWQSGIPMDDQLLRLTMPGIWFETLCAGLFLTLLLRFLIAKRRVQWFGYIWAVIAHIPLMAMPVGEHGFYLVALGWSVWLGEALDDALLWLQRRRQAVSGDSGRNSSSGLSLPSEAGRSSS
jgi:hypothetical protein